MRLPNKGTILLDDELQHSSAASYVRPPFKPVRDLHNPDIDRRNSWAKYSQLSNRDALPTPTETPMKTAAPAGQPLHISSPITPSNRSTTVTIPSSHLPPTPSSTPTKKPKRPYSSLNEMRVPTLESEEEKDQARPGQLKPNGCELSPSSTIKATSPLYPSKRQRCSISARSTSPSSTASASPSHSRTCLTESSTTTPKRRFRRPAFNPLTPPFSIAYRCPPSPSSPPISALELKRAAESILRQVDWEQVAEEVASNRASGVFRRVVRGVLQRGVDTFAQ